jgi:hypothetical protein
MTAVFSPSEESLTYWAMLEYPPHIERLTMNEILFIVEEALTV